MRLSNQLEDDFFLPDGALKHHGRFLRLHILYTVVTFCVSIQEVTTKHQSLRWVGLFKCHVSFFNTS